MGNSTNAHQNHKTVDPVVDDIFLGRNLVYTRQWNSLVIVGTAASLSVGEEKRRPDSPVDKVGTPNPSPIRPFPRPG